MTWHCYVIHISQCNKLGQTSPKYTQQIPTYIKCCKWPYYIDNISQHIHHIATYESLWQGTSSITSPLIYVYWCYMATYIWANVGSGNGLLPDAIKPLSEPMISSFKHGCSIFPWEQLHYKCPSYYSFKSVWALYFYNYCHTSHEPMK